jgi:hypothetical protein
MASLVRELDAAAATWDEPAGESGRLPVPQAAALISVASIVLWLGVVGVVVWVV